MDRPRLRELIITPAPLGSAEDDLALSRELLDRVASGELGSALRIWQPVPALALTRLDARRPGADAAAAAAAAAGLPTVQRLSGGHAVVLGPGALSLGLAEPAATFEGTGERYARVGDAIVEALATFGVHAEQGGLDGEWCPGAWSIRSGGVKLAGLAQRIVKGGAWIEAVIELAPDPLARRMLPEVYAALDLPLDLRTFGSLAELAPEPIAFEDLAARLTERLNP